MLQQRIRIKEKIPPDMKKKLIDSYLVMTVTHIQYRSVRNKNKYL